MLYYTNMTEPTVMLPESDTPSEVAIAQTLLPWRRDDNRAKFFAFLACGILIEEALYMLGLDIAWLEEQRKSPDFCQFELRLPEIRKELSKEYIELDFFRNFKLVLEKDYRILKKSIEEEELTKQEHEYLIKLRSAYSPQQLQILEQAMRGIGNEGWNFAQWVNKNKDKIIEISRTDKVRMIDNGKKDNNSQAGSSF